MYIAVRIGAHSPIKIEDEKWGNGWRDGREPFEPLSREDLAVIRSELEANPPKEIPPAAISAFYRDLESQLPNR
jgi:hypothetical protein